MINPKKKIKLFSLILVAYMILILLLTFCRNNMKTFLFYLICLTAATLTMTQHHINFKQKKKKSFLLLVHY